VLLYKAIYEVENAVEMREMIQAGLNIIQRKIFPDHSPVLLQEIILQELSHFERDFIALGQRSLTDELYDFRQIFLFLQDLLDLRPEGDKLGEVLVVEVVQGAEVLTARQHNVRTVATLAAGRCHTKRTCMK